MHRYVILSVVALGVGAAPARADVTFDFNDLTIWEGDDAIGQYMSDLYGSAVTTDDAITGLALDFSESPVIGTLAFAGWDDSLNRKALPAQPDANGGASFLRSASPPFCTKARGVRMQSPTSHCGSGRKASPSVEAVLADVVIRSRLQARALSRCQNHIM